MALDLDDRMARLREIEDRQAISEALYIYCRAVDRVDRELGYSIWHADAEVDYGEAIYVGPARGVIDYICDSHLRGIAHSHQIANILIRLTGETARSEAYVNSAMRMMHEGRLLQINTRGRYLDSWSRREGCWRIERRVFVADFDEVVPAVSASIPPRQRMGRDDPSYAHFGDNL